MHQTDPCHSVMEHEAFLHSSGSRPVCFVTLKILPDACQIIPVPTTAMVPISVLFILNAILITAVNNHTRPASSQQLLSLADSNKAKKTGENLVARAYFQNIEKRWRQLPHNAAGNQIRYGRELINATYKYLGPEKHLAGKTVCGNNLSCKNCHLDGGTRPYAAALVGIASFFPTYVGRENKIETIEERINGCFERSMNGKKLPVSSKEMKAMVAYIRFLSIGTPAGKRIAGQGFVNMTFPHRAADLEKGKEIYFNHCAVCHGQNGEGKRQGKEGDGRGYLYPPLWGKDSYNDGAGMYRLLTATRFIKANMPYDTSFNNPLLSDEEAFDVAAYINSLPRPQKANKEKDYPDLSKKPADCPYPPYADQVPQRQHQLGPFNFKPSSSKH